MIDVDHNDANPKFRPPSINQPTMKYTSTRDATKFYTFEEALFSGYARDGGLFVPEQLPNLLQLMLSGTKTQVDLPILRSIFSTWRHMAIKWISNAQVTNILVPFLVQEATCNI